jgi:uncharacterized membrane protein
MIEQARIMFEYITFALEIASAAIIAIGILYAAVNIIVSLIRKTGKTEIYRTFRVQVGRCIVLGLEILIAADIIKTLTIDQTFKDLGILAILILIRTFLSFTLEVEIDGRWPWQKK